MTKKELSKYAGERIFALCSRMGGKFKDIHCLTVYEITKRGTLHYCYEAMSCVANKGQYEDMMTTTGGYYVEGRPTAEKISRHEIENLIK